MLRRIEIKLFTLAAIACLAIAGTANAGITVDIEWTDGGTETSAAASSTVTAELFVSATGSTTIGGYQFTITWDSTELTYVNNPPIANPGGLPRDWNDSAFHTGPIFPRNASWTLGGPGEFFLASNGLPGFYSASTLTVDTDSILASDGKVSVGTIQFHVENGVVDDGAADVGGCYDCITFVGDGSFGSGDITATFNGAGINAPAGAVCGDGVVEGGEECDDGNFVGGDGCSATCTIEICGNGVLDPGEQCDDGNNDDTDFCSNSCIAAVCGDATTNGDEECDDGNADETDFCSNSCIAAVCGDGVVNGHDECDDGNTTNGDGCDSTCDLEDECGGDSTPPDIDSVTASPDVLWPPNHKMVSVAIAVSATDNCDPAPTCQVISVASNEPVTGKGDKTSPDWDVTGDLSLDLRAERSGKGSGRVYTATVECTDSLGNNSSEDVSVTVPHNQ